MKRIQRNWLTIFVLLVAGCSNDSSPPTFPVEARISDVGEVIGFSRLEHGFVVQYNFENVEFVGDLFLSEWRDLSDLVGPRLLQGEPILSVSNHRLKRSDSIFEGEVGIRTCTTPEDYGCRGGRWIEAETTADGWGVLFEGEWIIYTD